MELFMLKSYLLIKSYYCTFLLILNVIWPIFMISEMLNLKRYKLLTASHATVEIDPSLNMFWHLWNQVTFLNWQMWVDVFKWAIFGDDLSLDMDKLVLVENSWNMEIEDFMLNATRKQKKKRFPPQKNDCMWINASLKSWNWKFNICLKCIISYAWLTVLATWHDKIVVLS